MRPEVFDLPIIEYAYPLALIERVAEMRTEGLTYRVIAPKLGLLENTVMAMCVGFPRAAVSTAPQ